MSKIPIFLSGCDRSVLSFSIYTSYQTSQWGIGSHLMADSSAGAGYNASTRLVTHSQVICSNDGRSRRSSSGATSTQSIQSELDCDEMLADLDAYENELRCAHLLDCV